MSSSRPTTEPSESPSPQHEHGIRYPNDCVRTLVRVGKDLPRFRVFSQNKRLTADEALLVAVHIVRSVNDDARFFALLHAVDEDRRTRS